MGRTMLERETTIVFNDAEEGALLWTASPVQVQRWVRLGLDVSAQGRGWRTSVPKRCVRLRSPFIRRVLSEQHRAALHRHSKAAADARRPAKQADIEATGIRGRASPTDIGDDKK